MMEGELWLEHKRFALHTLRDFGLGKNLMQERVASCVMLIYNMYVLIMLYR